MPVDDQTSARYRELGASAVDDLLRSRPEWASSLGDHRFDDRIDDLSLGGLAEQATMLRRHRELLSGVEPTLLDAEDAVDQAMLLGELDRRLFEIDELAPERWDPLVYNVGEALYPLLSRQVLSLPDRLRAIAARLELIPERLEIARRQLEAPPLVHVETALGQHAGTLSMVGQEVDLVLQDEPGLRPVVEPAQARARQALDGYAVFLEELLEGPHRDPRLGPELFARKLALTLSSPIALDQLVQRAEDHLTAVTEALALASAGYLERGHEGTDVIREALDRVAEDAPDDDTVVASAEAALARCTAAVRELSIVSIPDEAFRIELMPVFRRGVAVAYCDPAGPLEEGGETSLAIAPTPDDWPAEQKASFYREYNSAMLVNLMVHEAMPGHMLQLARARDFNGSTLVRKVLISGPFAEGWAEHAERLMAEAGVGGPAVRLQQLKMQLRSTINAILDVSVHAGKMTEAEALELMKVRGYQEEGEARGKWRRACLTSAQLSTYFVGYSELDELFSSLGEPIDYDEVLAHGTPPPSLLGRLLKR